MKVTREKTENRQVYLTIEMEPAEVEAALEKSYQRLVKKASVPGFRKGKAPRAILERHIGKESLLDDALDNMVPEAYQRALKEQEIEAITRPGIEVIQTEPVVFKAVVPLAPVVEAGDYRSIKVSPEPVKVTDDDVNAVIEELRHQQAIWEPVGRPVEADDMVVMDIESTIDGSPFVNRKAIQYKVVPGANAPAPGFSEKLVGMERDGEQEFVLEYPSDYPRAELAGKSASFKVKVTEVKQEKLPELNDEFAQAVGADFKTVDALRQEIMKGLTSRAEDRARAELEERVVEAATSQSRVEFPTVLVDMEVDRLLNQQMQRWQRGERGVDEYLKAMNKTEEQLREELLPLATQRVTRSLVLDKIAGVEKIEAVGTEIDSEIEKMTEGAENKEELGRFLNNPQSREAIGQSLVTRKTIQRLVEIATGSPEEA